MRKKIFRHVFLMGAVVLLLSIGTVRLCCLQSTEEISSWPILLAAAILLLLVLIWSMVLARELVQPINEISPDEPKDTYVELQPLVDKVRSQNKTIRYQMDELRHRMREFTALTEHMSEGFLLLDRQGTVISGNHSARELLRTEKGKQVLIDADAALRQSVETALAGAHAEHLMHVQERTYHVVADPVRSSGQVAGAVVLILDVTEREQRDALRREFSANVSHELKTPLTTISGFAELMQQGLVPPEKISEFSGDIYRECRRLVALVDDIIKISRLDEGAAPSDREWVDLCEICSDVLEQLETPAQQHRVTLQLQGESVEIYGSRRLLQEMVYNLCENAIKYNKEGGSVTVSVTLQQGAPRLTVSDTGIGIPYAHQSRVFERFYRVDKSHSKAVGGTGLGLSIVKHAVQYHSARLELRSQPEQGTEITVWFDGPATERSNT
ncbi:MAG: histidine kinase [Ruminococcaceae bacterium]|nr:histidine kinase [Oscillospiraceae bacterium]